MLRPYQEKAVTEIQNYYRRGIKRVFLHLATGGGKTVVFCDIIKRAVSKNSKVLVTVKGVKLVEQASQRLEREGVEHGILQGGNTTRIHLGTLVSSIDTLYSRLHTPPADLIIIDEAHLSTGKAYEWFLNQYKDKFILAVSATPHLKQGLRHISDAIVYPISMRELTAQGFLVPLRYFAPTVPDLSRIKVKTTGDYDEGQLGEAMQKPSIRGDIVKNWVAHGENRPTILFCVTIEQSLKMVSEFEGAGVRAAHVDAKTPTCERNAAIERLKSGELQVLSNVGILCTGVDIPPLSCIISARPTKSYNLWIQQLGRGTRPFPGKADCIVFDHASNTLEHGFAADEKVASLEPQPKRVKKKQTDDFVMPTLIRCKQCFAVFEPPEDDLCPTCGAELPPTERKAARYEKKHRLEELQKPAWEYYLDALIIKARAKGYKKGFIYYKIKEKYGEEIANQAWPRIKVLRKWEVKTEAARTNFWSNEF